MKRRAKQRIDPVMVRHCYVGPNPVERVMGILKKIKPSFWDQPEVAVRYKRLYNFRRIWKLTVILTSAVAVLPLFLFALIDYNVSKHSVESEIILRTARYTSNTRRSVSFFLNERKAALDFAVHDNTFEELCDPMRLAELLENLRKSFGKFTDIGVIDSFGYQRIYMGPHRLELEGKDYSDQAWFAEVVNKGKYISEIFMGFRNTPHLVIAVRHYLPDGSFYVLRATLEQQLSEMLSKMEVAGLGDTFLINRQGMIQTPSLYYGDIFEKIPFEVPGYSERTNVIEKKNLDGTPIVVGYAYLPETPLILMVIKQKNELMKPWYETRMDLIWYLAISVTVIIIWILGMATYLVSRLHIADQKRVRNLHMVEYSGKMASIGRLAAGVAHEINNPLAIINEKAGLIKDMFTYNDKYAKDGKLIGIVDAILSSVERCGRITRRLLRFARHMDVSIQPINLEEVISEVLGFLGKEAEYRSIDVSLDVSVDIPRFESDRGKLQQIFLNIINNAFAAMSDGGRLEIKARLKNENFVSVDISDNGCGIPESDLKRVFEPFFSTKGDAGGTGLGLSITYGLVQEIEGEIKVESKEGVGTTFTVTLPLKAVAKREVKT